MHGPEIETERLLLRQRREDDYLPFVDMCRDPQVMQYIGSGEPMREEQVLSDIRKYQKVRQKYGLGQFAVERRDVGRFIGFAGLDIHSLLPDYQSLPEIGWRIDRSVWGRRYASGAAAAIMSFAMDECELNDVVSVCQTSDKVSERIMRKIGLRFEKETSALNSARLIRIYRSRKSIDSNA